ncbi:MgtC/SapB family protein [Bogoriella caseilytica]|uniref:Putative Mg2+ transporter-C (MgtC) family protein n=1 Tax=Bogoriella caseilytica TaxID=56055 RepID=A0A3N2BCD4_9MICO|nr:MgtC/SapB family protein [Bogoriella caseilytica]ROR72900.1 putative Mg2+ transporter-C (MgtC) family protein [Bogoriella caseilytica]
MFFVSEDHLILEVLVRVGSAFACGALIGVERQWRGRSAGLRTNTLVCVGAALFVLLSSLTPDDASPSRVAAQVVSGVGFLGAGVIIKEGGSLRGINTAATLWGSAAVGSLCGAGMYIPAAAGVIAIGVGNALLRPVARVVEPKLPPDRTAEEPVDYEFTAICHDGEEAHVRALVVQAMAAEAFSLNGLHSEDIEGTGRVSVVARLTSPGRDDRVFENAVSRLSLERGVTSVRWRVLPHQPVGP